MIKPKEEVLFFIIGICWNTEIMWNKKLISKIGQFKLGTEIAFLFFLFC